MNMMIGRQSRMRRLAARLWSAEAVRYDPPWLPPGADRAIAVPFGFEPTLSDGRRAVMIHLFHPDLAPLFRDLACHVPGAVDLLISTDTPEKADTIRRAFDGWAAGTVDIRVAPNRGRDMAPKFVTFAASYARYDQVLFLHSKKSSYFDRGRNWRDVLTAGLVGSTATVRSILAMFDADPALGIVFPQHYDGIRDRLGWGSNRERVGDLCRRMGIALGSARALEFVSGSMFWARPAALAPVLALGLSTDEFAPEEGQVDGTLAHAIERVLLYAAESEGYTWLKTAHAGCYSDPADVLPVTASGDLHVQMARARYRLLGKGVRRDRRARRAVHRV